MKLFVDDIRNAPDDTWHVARTALEAIRAIARYDFEVISLDHDISHQVSIGGDLERPFPCKETFASVAYYIAAKHWHEIDLVGSARVMRANIVPRVILHTSNEVAGDEMAAMLKEHGIIAEKKYMGAANRLEMEL